jgi:hypothetical protein
VKVTDLGLGFYVPAPFNGGTPVWSVAGPEYTGTVVWFVTGGASHTGLFEPNTAYTATLTLAAGAGYTFTGVLADSFTHVPSDVPSGAIVRNQADTGLVTIDFPPTGSTAAVPVTDLVLDTYIPKPVTGRTPKTRVDESQYTGTVEWTKTAGGASHAGLFAANTAYTATVRLIAKSGFTFDGVVADTFTHTGAPGGVSNAAGTGSAITVTIDFPETAGMPVTDLDLTYNVIAPTENAIPVTGFDRPQYTGAAAWKKTLDNAPHSGFFEINTAYTATVTLTAKTGYTFNGIAANAFIHGGADTSVMPSNPAAPAGTGGTIIVTIVFPATPTSATAVTDLALTYNVTAPTAGGSPVTSFRGPQYAGRVDWFVTGGSTPYSDIFRLDTAYTAVVTMLPDPGFTFTGVLANTFTHAGAPGGVTNDLNSNVVTINFPKTGKLPPLASGGDIKFLMAIPGYYYEVHVFPAAGTYSLDFVDTSTASISADYLIVAGGGGSGGSGVDAKDFPGGGGAGGLLYKAGQTLALSGGSVTVTVGAGGAAGASRSQGGDGGYSFIGTIAVSGGGGGGAYNVLPGRPGGSGGGGSAGAYSNSGAGGAGKSNTSGNSQSIDSGIQGNNGGRGSNAGSSTDGGGGGGGAGSAGANGNPSGGGAGGAGWKPSAPGNNGWAWVETVTGVAEFSHGGNGGYPTAPPGGAPGVYFGDGASGGNGANTPGAAGHGGIVIIRFLHPGKPA